MNKNKKVSKIIFSSFDDLSKILDLNPVSAPVIQKEKRPNSFSKHRKIDDNNTKMVSKSKEIRIKGKIKSKKTPRKAEIVKFNQDLFYELKVKAREKQRNKSHSRALALYTQAVDLALEFIKKSRALGENKNEKGDVDGALKEYKEANKVFKKLSPIMYNRGVIRQKMKDFSGAIEDYNFVVKYHPNHKASYIKRVEIRDRLGEFDLVIEDLQEIIKLDINNRSFYYKLAGIYLVKGDFAEAIKDYKNALSKDPRNPDKILTKSLNFIAKGKIKLALRELDFVLVRLEKIINKFRSAHLDKKISEVEFVQKLNIPLYNLYTTRADVLRKNGIYDKSESDYSKAIHFNVKHDNMLYLNRAFVLTCLNRIEEAIQDYTCILEHDDKNIKTYIARGDLYLQQKLYDKALKDFEMVLNLEPFNIPMYKKLGDVKFEQGDYKGAEAEYDHVLDFNKNDQKLFFKKALIKIYNNDKTGFLSVLKSALASNKLTSVTAYKEAKKLLNNKKNQKSFKIINSFISANQNFLDLVLDLPDILTFFAVEDELILRNKLIVDLNIKYIEALLLRVEISKQSHNYKKILPDLKEILSRDNSNYEALKHMAEFYLFEHEYKKALTYIKKCFNLEKHSEAALFFFRGNAYEGLSDFENAVKDYQKAIKLNHRSSIYHTRLGISAFSNNMFEVSIYALQQSLEIDKKQDLPCTFLSRIYLTSTDVSLRNIIQGFSYAKKALELNKSAENYEIMAIAYSLKNMFDKALEMQENALELSTSDNGKRLLKLYQDNKPWVPTI